MNTFKLRMICSDLDGTLLKKDGTVHPDNLRAIREAREKGILFAVATGRATGNALAKIRQAGIFCPVSAMNGTVLTDEDGSVLRRHPMTRRTAVEIERVLAGHQADYVLMGEKVLCTSREDFYHHSELEYGPEMEKMGYRFFRGRETVRRAAEKEAVYKYYVCRMQDPERLIREAQEVGRVTLTRSGRDNLEIMTEGVDKATGIMELADLKGIRREEIMAVGDEMNDLPMIRWAGWGVAMGNGADRVKEEADLVTASNEEGGVAKAVRFLLGRAAGLPDAAGCPEGPSLKASGGEEKGPGKR